MEKCLTCDELRKENERLEDLLASVYETTLEQDTKSRIANNMDASPNGYKFRQSERDKLQAKCAGLREALEGIMNVVGTSTLQHKIAREALEKYK